MTKADKKLRSLVERGDELLVETDELTTIMHQLLKRGYLTPDQYAQAHEEMTNAAEIISDSLDKLRMDLPSRAYELMTKNGYETKAGEKRREAEGRRDARKTLKDWLQDHPGKTVSDHDKVSTCAATQREHEEYWAWFWRRYDVAGRFEYRKGQLVPKKTGPR